MFKLFTKETLIALGALIGFIIFMWQVNKLESKKRDLKEQQVEIKTEQKKEEASVEIIEAQMENEINITQERTKNEEEIPTTIGHHTITFD